MKKWIIYKIGMDRLNLPDPVSVGIILSYKCSSACDHCMYACSPSWRADWFPVEGLELVLRQIAPKLKASPYGPESVSMNYGLHFTGGEPFLNFNLLVSAVKLAHRLGVPSTFVETNCFWCVDDEDAVKKLTTLKEAGLNGILVSVNPFILEQVPFERTERAVRVSRDIFGENTMTYQEIYYRQFKDLGIRGTLPLDQYLRKCGLALRYAELLPMGRACYRLKHLFVKHPAESFFGESCTPELIRNWHVHVDNYLNYMTGYCGGISMCDARDLSILRQGLDLSERPIIRALTNDIGDLYALAVREFDYKEREEGYISKCHLCVDIRRHIVQRTESFKELQPRELYYHLE